MDKKCDIYYKAQLASFQQTLFIRFLTNKLKTRVNALKNLHYLKIYVLIEYKSQLFIMRV